MQWSGICVNRGKVDMLQPAGVGCGGEFIGGEALPAKFFFFFLVGVVVVVCFAAGESYFH